MMCCIEWKKETSLQSEQDSQGSSVQEYSASECNNMPVTDAVDDSVCDNAPAGERVSQSVWGPEPSLESDPSIFKSIEVDDTESIEVDGVKGAIRTNVQDLPSLVTQGVAEPFSMTQRDPPIQPESGASHVSSGNAWSRGSPSFMSNTNYTGQALRGGVWASSDIEVPRKSCPIEGLLSDSCCVNNWAFCPLACWQ